MRLIRFALTLSIVFVMGVNMAMGDSSVYDKTFTWTDSTGVEHQNAYKDKATDPHHILALLGHLYIDKDVPGFKQHLEYNTSGTRLSTTDQLSQINIDYDLQGRMYYLYRPGTNGKWRDDTTNPLAKAGAPRDRVSWISRLLPDFTGKSYSTPTSDYSGSTTWAYKDYTDKIEAPTQEGATILLVQVKDTWKDSCLYYYSPKDVTGLAQTTNNNTKTPYAGYYFWNSWPTQTSCYKNKDGNPVNKDHTTRALYKANADAATDYKNTFDYTPYLYESDVAYVEDAIESVQLIHNTFRVNDPDNPGYLCIVDTLSTGRFFFIAKGRVRATNFSPPFYNAWEQISPITKDNNGVVISPSVMTDNLISGSIYGFQHDCGNVFWGDGIDKNHTCKVATDSAGNVIPLENLTLFLTDKRFTKDGKAGGNYHKVTGTDMTIGVNKYGPKMLLYRAQLSAAATPSETQQFYDIKLDWDTWFSKTKIGAEVEEQFYVYAVTAVDDQGNPTAIQQLDVFIAANDDYEQDTPVDTTRSKTYTYRVRILDNSQKFTYIISANPIDPATELGSDIMVNSNTATVWVPGRDQFALDGSEYRSRYDRDTEQNLYRNTLRMRPNAAFDNIPANSEYYQMWRKTVGTEDSVLVATVTFTLLDDNPRSYSYTVSYKQSIPTLCFDAEPARSTSGVLFDNVSIDLVDYFNVSTAANEQPAEYSYALHNKSVTLSSDDFNVPVNKTKHTAYLNPLTYAQVMADTDHSVGETAKNATVNIAAIDNAGSTLQRYDLYRIEDGNTTHVGKVERQSGSTFAVSQSTDGTTWTPGTTVDLSTPQNITFTEQFDQQPDGALQYLPVITNMDPGLDVTTVENTYGCDILDVYPVDFSFGAEAISQSLRYAANPVDPDNHERIYRAYKAQLDLTPLLLNADADVYMYRVWREVDGVETLLNTVTPPEVTQEGDLLVDELAKTYPGENAKQIYDYVIYPELQDGEELNVNYIARLYSCIDPVATPTLPSGAPRRSNVPDRDRFYYVREMTGSVQFTNSIITGVDRVDNTPTVVRVIYYNLVGMPSAQPWPGLNVECRVMSDGTTVTRKLVR